MARKLTEEELYKVTGGDVTSANAIGYQVTQFACRNRLWDSQMRHDDPTLTPGDVLRTADGNFAIQEGGAALPPGIIGLKNEIDAVR